MFRLYGLGSEYVATRGNQKEKMENEIGAVIILRISRDYAT